jgi:hypothetical protein
MNQNENDNEEENVGADRLFLMTKLFNLDFHRTKFAVPKGHLLSSEVQSSVPLGIFEVFARSLETGTKVPVTKENAG